MNEFDRDCMEKKSIARSAHKRPGMYLGTNCSLPSDHLTAAEMQQMSGPLVSYQLGKPMTWDDFKQLPTDLMRLYLQNLQNKYGGTADRVAEMLGVSRTMVFRYSRTCRVSWSRPKNDAESAKAWALFMGDPLPEEADDAPAAEEPGGST